MRANELKATETQEPHAVACHLWREAVNVKLTVITEEASKTYAEEVLYLDLVKVRVHLKSNRVDQFPRYNHGSNAYHAPGGTSVRVVVRCV